MRLRTVELFVRGVVGLLGNPEEVILMKCGNDEKFHITSSAILQAFRLQVGDRIEAVIKTDGGNSQIVKIKKVFPLKICKEKV